jgi:replication-associated recombination protein RarA
VIPVFGHERVRQALEESVPPVVLLRGPASVGKWTLAQYLAQHHGVLPVDLRSVAQLTAEAARDLRRFSSTAPFGVRKMVVLRLDGASEQALNALLKLLEEPPPVVSFVLVSSVRTLDTIASRAQVHPVGLLSRSEVEQVLVHRVGMSQDAARDLSAYSRGQVAPLLERESSGQSRAAVLSVLKALSEGDCELLDLAASKWDAEAHELLRRWCVEALTGEWSVFTEAETFGLLRQKMYPVRVLRALSLDARPRLAVRALLEPLLAPSS